MGRRKPYLPEGNSKRIEIEVSAETRRAWKRFIAQVDPDLTYEQALHLCITAYHEEPDLFEEVNEFGPTG